MQIIIAKRNMTCLKVTYSVNYADGNVVYAIYVAIHASSAYYFCFRMTVCFEITSLL